MSYRKKSELVEAHQWTGSNWHQMLEFAGREAAATDGRHLFINGRPVGEKGWVVKQGGTLYVATDEAFQQMYEEVETPE